MTCTILTIDDSKTIRSIIKKTLKPYDCEVVEATDGMQGVAIATRINPDLILLDNNMPGMTGVQTLEAMGQVEGLKKIPVIMLTADGSRDIVLEVVRLGAKEYLRKPFKGPQLIRRIEKLLPLRFRE